jgi:hypothetical protein
MNGFKRYEVRLHQSPMRFRCRVGLHKWVSAIEESRAICCYCGRTTGPPSPNGREWLTQSPDEVVRQPEVDHVVVDDHWSVREIVLRSGSRIRSEPREPV